MEVSGSGNGFPLDVTNMDSKTPEELRVTNMDPRLFEAVTSGMVHLLDPLLEENVDILQQVTPIEDTSIHIAAGHGHLEIIQSIHIHSQCKSLLRKVNLMGDTPLHRAARAGHLSVLHFLIDCAKNSQGSSSKDIEIGTGAANDILRKGNTEKDNVMHEAVRRSHLEMVKLLIKEDPQLLCMLNLAGQSPLVLAVEKGALDIVEQIVKSNPCSSKGPKGRSALHDAIINKRPDMIKLLLEKKPELVEEADDNGRTPLHFASSLGFLDSVKMLLECSTSTTCYLDKTGSAPLHMSVHFGRLDIIKEFIQLQPDIKDLLDGRRRNLLHIAIEHQQVGVIKYILKEKGLERLVNGKDMDGNTPLHQASVSGNPYIVNILIRDKRVDPTALNHKGYTALEIARSQRDECKKLNKTYTQPQSFALATLLHASRPTWCNRKSFLGETFGHDNQLSVESSKKKAEILLVVATLVATVTFAAGFTLPGGYLSDGPHQGMATLQKFKSFEAFVFCDAIGMYSAISAVFALIWLEFVMNARTVRMILLLAQLSTTAALIFMTVAFMAGLYLTTSELKGLNIWISSLGSILCTISLVGLLLATIQNQSWTMLIDKRLVYLFSLIYEFFRGDENNVSILFHYGV